MGIETVLLWTLDRFILMWVEQHFFIGGMFTMPKLGWFMAWFYQYHFTNLKASMILGKLPLQFPSFQRRHLPGSSILKLTMLSSPSYDEYMIPSPVHIKYPLSTKPRWM